MHLSSVNTILPARYVSHVIFWVVIKYCYLPVKAMGEVNGIANKQNPCLLLHKLFKLHHSLLPSGNRSILCGSLCGAYCSSSAWEKCIAGYHLPREICVVYVLNSTYCTCIITDTWFLKCIYFEYQFFLKTKTLSLFSLWMLRNHTALLISFLKQSA